MRVVIASLTAPTYTGGLAAYARQLAEALGQAGAHQVSYACIFERHSDLPYAGPLTWPVHSLLNPSLWANLTKTIFRRLASRASLHGILEKALQLLLPDWKLLAAIGRPEIIHFVGTGWDLLGLRLLQYARRIGVMFTVLPAVHPGNWGDGAIDLRLYRRADAVFCLSDFEAAHLVRLGVGSGHIVRCGLAPNCEASGDGERLRGRLDLGQRPAVLFIGRRDEGKGYPALLAAWGQVLALVPDAVLILAGPGGQEYEALRAGLPQENMRDLAIPDEQTKADALAACDVFCLPSAHESFGIVYLEAWSYGKPVVCGTAPACRELVADGRTGLWADEEPSSIAERLIHLLSAPEQSQRMGASGRMFQRENCTPEHLLRVHLRTWSMQVSKESLGDRACHLS